MATSKSVEIDLSLDQAHRIMDTVLRAAKEWEGWTAKAQKKNAKDDAVARYASMAINLRNDAAVIRQAINEYAAPKCRVPLVKDEVTR